MDHFDRVDLEFALCDECVSKLGSPTLCTSCLRNRRTIDTLKGWGRQSDAQIEKLTKRIGVLVDTLGKLLVDLRGEY